MQGVIIMTNKTNTKNTVTIGDIAKKLNIAPSTVSRALNNNSRISEATREKVQQAAREAGYELNLVASSLSKNKTNLIGVIVPHLNSQFFSKALSSIQETVQEAGYNVIICQTNDLYRQEVEMAKVMNATRVDGLIVSLSQETKETGHFKNLVDKNIPVGMFDRIGYELTGAKVIIDNYEAGYKAAEHLINCGCQRLAFLSGPYSVKIFEERAKGFRDALKEHKLPLLPQHLLACDLSERDTREAMKLWAGMKQSPDGIVAATSKSGINLMTSAKNHGFKIPVQLSIISIGNDSCHELMEPALSAVDIPGQEMGKAIALKVIEQIENGKIENEILIRPIELIIRNSTFKI